MSYFKSKVLNVIILVNISIFLLYHLFVYKYQNIRIENIIALNSNILFDLFLPYLFLTHGFFHTNFYHLLGNMIFLLLHYNLISKISDKYIVEVYLKSAFGAGVLWLLYNTFLNDYKNSILLGASGAIYGVITYVCVFYGDNVLFKVYRFNFLIKYLLFYYIFLIINNIYSGVNIGGEVSHFGGVVVGYYLCIKHKK